MISQIVPIFADTFMANMETRNFNDAILNPKLYRRYYVITQASGQNINGTKY